ncbi:hypothetical protein HYALB_00004184 [Hymenoscyphus albidus]|uniref:Gfd2/YDR514C-like C-terminal domain-containing protein n=1 Tax=Hymenoscyphus albidus TaxID=595503 RepID=A0A9N9M6U9_9HELO|nr:hypothetical protein HYALB_00004184 [Hymenoscyphus albidus]
MSTRPTPELDRLHALLLSHHKPLFVSIDFEGHQFICKGFKPSINTQVGLSILDTNKLSQPLPKGGLAIDTFHYVTGERAYFEKVERTTNWGKSQHIYHSEMGNKIKQFLPRDRKIVLVGHGISGDIAALRKLRINLGPTAIMGTLDTCTIFRELTGRITKLKDILVDVGCIFSRLHNASNDANFTLRALLLLAINNPGKSSLQDWQADAFRAISTEPLPEKAMGRFRNLERRDQKLLKVTELNFPGLPTSKPVVPHTHCIPNATSNISYASRVAIAA